MGRKTFTFGVGASFLGLALGVFPFVTVWLVAGEAMREVPVPVHAHVESESREAGAMFNEDFVLASRVLSSITADEVTADLRVKGFTLAGSGRTGWLARACCRSYDAVLVENFDQADGTVRQRITVSDSDGQAILGLLVMTGFVIFLFGARLAFRAHAQIKTGEQEAAKRSEIIDA